jgi:hypothetical protein
MSSDWIKVRTVMPSDGRIRVASRKCHALPVTVFGALVTLWCLADAHADENGELIGYTSEDIDALVCVPGFASALPTDWIDLSGEFVKLPQYQEHNGATGKQRAKDAKRQKDNRAVQKVSQKICDKTWTREEKKREEKKEDKGAPFGADLLLDVDPQVASDFLALRRGKKALITPTAINGIRREAAKAGLTLESALRMCCERGWTGFKADWAGVAGAVGAPKVRAQL